MNKHLKVNPFCLALLPLLLIAISLIDKFNHSNLYFLISIVLFLFLAIPNLLETNQNKLVQVFIAPLIVFLPILYIYFSYDGWYTYGWHNFLQLDTIYSWTLNNGDLSYYGQELTYPYFGLLPLAQLSYWAKTSPLNIFFIFNVFCFIAWFSVYLANLKGKTTKYSVFAILFFFTFGGLTYFIEPLILKSWEVEVRATPVFSKFMYIDAMVIGIPSLAIQYYFSKKEGLKNSFLSFLFGLQAIVSYPLLGPTVILVSFSSFIFEKNAKLRNILYTVLLSIALLVILKVLKGTSESPSFYFEQHFYEIIRKSIKAYIICALPLFFLVLRVYKEGFNRDNMRVIFIACISFELFAFIVLPMSVQYKFIYGAIIILGFSTIDYLEKILDSLKLSSFMLCAILFLGVILASFLLTKHVPHHKTSVPLPNKDSFFISSKLTDKLQKLIVESDFNKPKKVLISNTTLPLTLFLRLPEYFDLQQDPKTGYGMSYSDIVLDVKRNNSEDFEFRKQSATKIIFYGDMQRVNLLKSKLDIDVIIVASDRKIANCPGKSQKYLEYVSNQKSNNLRKLYLCFY